MTKHIGNAPCGKCGEHAYDLELTGKADSAIDGGEWWEVGPDQWCDKCGEPFLWLHVPADKVVVREQEQAAA